MVKKPTLDMIDFFTRRTNAHIGAVNYFAGFFSVNFPDHDASKFSEPERTPYIFSAAAKRLGFIGLDDDMKQGIKDAHDQHYKNNDHHPEFWKPITEMPNSCLKHMVCDWWAMLYESMYYGDPVAFGHVLDYYKAVACKKFDFAHHQKSEIENAINHLDLQNRDNRFDIEIKKIFDGCLA